MPLCFGYCKKTSCVLKLYFFNFIRSELRSQSDLFTLLSRFKWKLYVRPLVHGVVTKVIFGLDQTFKKNKITFENPPFELRRNGWGEFSIGVEIYIEEERFDFMHDLCLSESRSAIHTINLEEISLVRLVPVKINLFMKA